MCMGFLGGGLEGYVLCCVLWIKLIYFYFYPVCLFIIISLNAFDIALMRSFFFSFSFLRFVVVVLFPRFLLFLMNEP